MKRKLLIVMPSLSRGGGERVVSELSRVFSEHGEVVIAVFERKKSYVYKGRIVDLGVPLRENVGARVFLFFKRFWRLRSFLREEMPDTVMTLGLPVNLMAIVLAKQPIVRIDMFISVARKGIFGWIMKKLAKLLLKRAGLVVAVSGAIAIDLQERYRVPREKLRVIYNPTDTARIRERAREGVSSVDEEIFERPVIVTMGRLAQQKGQWHLLRAFRRVCQLIPEARLVILGEGELLEKLQELGYALGVAENIHFLGWRENPFAYVSRARVFALSSLWEGLPDVLLEALACGTPIVSTDCRSGPREVLAPSTYPLAVAKTTEQAEYGILVPVCDGKWRDAGISLSREEKTMADTLVAILRDEELRKQLAEKAVQRAKDFDIQTIAPQWKFLWERTR